METDSEEPFSTHGVVVSAKALKSIRATRERILKRDRLLRHDFKRHLENLFSGLDVEVGWRSCCGNKADATEFYYKNFRKVVDALRKSGLTVSERAVKHDNSWATKNGGFWNSYIFSLERTSTDGKDV